MSIEQIRTELNKISRQLDAACSPDALKARLDQLVARRIQHAEEARVSRQKRRSSCCTCMAFFMRRQSCELERFYLLDPFLQAVYQALFNLHQDVSAFLKKLENKVNEIWDKQSGCVHQYPDPQDLADKLIALGSCFGATAGRPNVDGLLTAYDRALAALREASLQVSYYKADLSDFVFPDVTNIRQFLTKLDEWLRSTRWDKMIDAAMKPKPAGGGVGRRRLNLTSIEKAGIDAFIKQHGSPYAYLGVNMKADQEAIKSAFRKRSLEDHPDRREGDELRFKVLSRAKEIVLNQRFRAYVDECLRPNAASSMASAAGRSGVRQRRGF